MEKVWHDRISGPHARGCEANQKEAARRDHSMAVLEKRKERNGPDNKARTRDDK